MIINVNIKDEMAENFKYHLRCKPNPRTREVILD
jgi:hypothetical protein